MIKIDEDATRSFRNLCLTVQDYRVIFLQLTSLSAFIVQPLWQNTLAYCLI